MIDSYWYTVKSLLYFSGENNSTSITDFCSGEIGIVGSARLSTNQSLNNSSLVLDTNGSYITVRPQSGYKLNVNTWTIETWFYKANSTDCGLMGTHEADTAGPIDLAIIGDQLKCWCSSVNGVLANGILGSTTLSNNQWYHLAIVRYFDYLFIFLDGQFEFQIQIGTVPLLDINNCLYLGWSAAYVTNTFNGYFGQTRVSVGHARYFEPFTPDSSVFWNISQQVVADGEVCLQLDFNGGHGATTFTEATGKTVLTRGDAKLSASCSKFCNTSLYLDGNGDYVEIPHSVDLNLLDADFTIELWAYIVESKEQILIQKRSAAGANNTEFILSIKNTNAVALNCGDGTSYFFPTGLITASTFSLNQWVHIAVTRKGSLFTIWLNGIAGGALSSSSVMTKTNSAVFIGYDPYNDSVVGNRYLHGFVGFVRITKRLAVYTETFNPIDDPEQYDPYFYKTSVLLPFTGANNSTVITDQSNNKNVCTVVGTAKISTDKYKFDGSSLYLNGGTGYVDITHSDSLDLGTGDFTLECWLYVLSGTVEFNIISSGVPGSSGFTLGWNTGGTSQQYYFSIGSTSYVLQGPTIDLLNRWSHVAVVRANDVFYLFCDFALASQYSGTVFNFDVTTALHIGANRALTAFANGYIDSFRLTKGVARYPKAFPVLREFYYPLLKDQYSGSVVLSMSCNGDNNTTVLKDNINASRAITFYGTAKVSTAQAKNGLSSLYLDGTTGSYVTVANNGDLDLGVGDFTIEMFVYPQNTSGLFEFCSMGVVDATGFYWNYNMSTGVLAFGAETTPNILTATILIANFRYFWNHAAIVREAGVFRLFVNGVLLNSRTLANINMSSGNVLKIGTNRASDASANGYFNSIRITKGVARYSAIFSVPNRGLNYSDFNPHITDPYYSLVTLLLPFNDPIGSVKFGDYSKIKNQLTVSGDTKISSEQSKFGLGSAYFDGLGDYVTAAGSGLFDVGLGDFTIEMWLCPTAVSGYGALAYFVGGKGLYQNNNTFLWYDSGQKCVSATIVVNTWYHVAAVCKNLEINVFVNGKKSTTSFTSTTSYVVSSLMIGSSNGSSEFYKGYISQYRFTKGVARYLADFTPLNQPFPTIYHDDPWYNQVTLLVSMNDSFRDTSTYNQLLTTTGTPQITTTNSKVGGSSGYFDGGANYLTINNDSLALRTLDFTVEFWVYLPSYPGNGVNYDENVFGGSNSNMTFLFYLHNSNGHPRTWDGSLAKESTLVIPLNQWTHVAYTRANGVFRIYVNGAKGHESTYTIDILLPTSGFNIGGNPFGDNTRYVNGYLNDLRITKGIARYIHNFIPPINKLYPISKIVATLNPIVSVFSMLEWIANPARVVDPLRVVVEDPTLPTTMTYYDGGPCSISDIVTYNGVPASRKVSLFTLVDKRLVAETWSDPITGAYSFTRLKDQAYFVWCEDYLRVFDPVTHLVQVDT